MCRLDRNTGKLAALVSCRMTSGEATTVLRAFFPHDDALSRQDLKVLQRIFHWLELSHPDLKLVREIFPDLKVSEDRLEKLYKEACDRRERRATSRMQTENGWRRKHQSDCHTATGTF